MATERAGRTTGQQPAGVDPVAGVAVTPDGNPAQPAIEVALATPADSASISLLVLELLAFYGLPSKFQRSYMTHMIATEAFGERSGLEILLARDRGHAVGLLAFSQSFALANCQHSFFIQDLFVTRRLRGLAVGWRLMRGLAELASERGISQIDWTADPWNDRAARFYERMGPLLRSEKTFYRLMGPNLRNLLKD